MQKRSYSDNIFCFFGPLFFIELLSEIIFRPETQPQHFEIEREDMIKYFTFLQRLFNVEDLETAAEIFNIMSEREQEKFYTLMKDFLDPASKLARERVVHWANQYVGKVLK